MVGETGDLITAAALQEFDPDVMLGESLNPCTALLASVLNKSWVNYWPIALWEPYLSHQWGAMNQLHLPNPLRYLPQMSMRTSTQYMVRSTSLSPS